MVGEKKLNSKTCWYIFFILIYFRYILFLYFYPCSSLPNFSCCGHATNHESLLQSSVAVTNIQCISPNGPSPCDADCAAFLKYSFTKKKQVTAFSIPPIRVAYFGSYFVDFSYGLFFKLSLRDLRSSPADFPT